MSGSAVLLACAQELNRRCLRVGAKWALELHAGMARELPAGLEAVPPELCAAGAPLEEGEEGAHELARAYITGKEFARAAHLLDSRYAPSGAPAASPAAYPPSAFFLRCYALYLVRAGACAPKGRGRLGFGGASSPPPPLCPPRAWPNLSPPTSHPTPATSAAGRRAQAGD